MNMLQAMMDVVNMAKIEGCLIYLYESPTSKEFRASKKYWKDWLFRAYPGGRMEFSVLGKELFDKNNLEVQNES